VTSPDPELSGAGWELHVELNTGDDSVHVGMPVTGEVFLKRAADHDPSRASWEVQVLMYFCDPDGRHVPGHNEPDSALGGKLKTNPDGLETEHMGFQIMAVCPGRHTLSVELLDPAGKRLGDTTLALDVHE
jgi:hypothetical protein